MTAKGFQHEPYEWRGTTEWMLVRGSNYTSHVVVLSPLFEEMNHLRGFIVDIARLLAGKGIGSWLPDLPGTGESLRELRDIGWDDWRDAVRNVGDTIASRTGTLPHVVAFRGGALLSDAVDGRSWWSYAPATGASLLRHLERTQRISNIENELEDTGKSGFLAGYELSPGLREALGTASERPGTGPQRSVPAGEGMPLWHRPEPGRDPELSAVLADDIAAWVATCEGR